MYAEKTTVSSEKSRQEIERTLVRYGAASFAYGWENGKAVIMFEMSSRRIRFLLPLPEKTEKRFTHNSYRNERAPEAIEKLWEQACRQKWRALALAVKAKLECVQSGITTFENEFLAHIVLPNGTTVGGWFQPKLAQAYESGKMPPLLLTEGPN